MERTLTIRHNWHNRDESKWLFWLEKKLVELGFSVSLADMPASLQKDTHKGIEEIQNIHGIFKHNTHIVRFDPGCLTLLKYCEQLLKQPSQESRLLIAGIPKQSHDASLSILKMIGGPKGLIKSDDEEADDIKDYTPDPQQLTLDTIDIKLVVVYGGELTKTLSHGR